MGETMAVQHRRRLFRQWLEMTHPEGALHFAENPGHIRLVIEELVDRRDNPQPPSRKYNGENPVMLMCEVGLAVVHFGLHPVHMRTVATLFEVNVDPEVPVLRTDLDTTTSDRAMLTFRVDREMFESSGLKDRCDMVGEEHPEYPVARINGILYTVYGTIDESGLPIVGVEVVEVQKEGEDGQT